MPYLERKKKSRKKRREEKEREEAIDEGVFPIPCIIAVFKRRSSPLEIVQQTQKLATFSSIDETTRNRIPDSTVEVPRIACIADDIPVRTALLPGCRP